MTDAKDGSASERAYRAAGRMVRDKVRRDQPLDAAALEALEASDVVVVRGGYDHVERVLRALGLPFEEVEPERVGALRLRPEQLVVVNCPGHLDAAAIRTVADFVHRGGSLFTTDWALRHVIEPAFPGIIAYNDRPTRDDVVRVEVRDRENRFVAGVFEEGDDPVWWLEGSSYPIRILDPERVEVLITSAEMRDKYGEPAIAVLFAWGEGEVFHMVSHYYLQRTELRDERKRQPAAAWAASKGLSMSDATAREVEDMSFGDIEAAASSSAWMARVIADKKRRHLRREEDGGGD